MKVVMFNSSPRVKGNTSIMLGWLSDKLAESGIKSEVINIAKLKLRGCTACMSCKKKQNFKCKIDDGLNDCIKEMMKADGIVLGSPTYFADVNSDMKAFIDRAGYTIKNGGTPLMHKVGASVTAVRRAGAIHTLDTMNHLFQGLNMFIVGSSYWNLAVGRGIGEVEKDEEGKKTIDNLGANMALLMKKLK